MATDKHRVALVTGGMGGLGRQSASSSPHWAIQS
jgi:NAD(P)-dependent dehydrogenase (short-subunit alcohol dehydrogenase family)